MAKSREIGSIHGSVVLENKASDTAKQVAKDLGALDGAAKQAGAGFKSLGADIAKSAAGWMAAGAIMGQIQKLNAWLVEGARGADEAAQAQASLQKSLGTSAKSLVDYSNALAKVTRFEDETILKAEAMIGQFIKSETMIKRLMPVVADFATAKGMDLVSAADLVTKTIASENNALGRYGIEIKGAAASTERFEQVIQKLNTAFGGQAEAMAGVGMGPLEMQKKALGDISEELSVNILPAMIQWKEIQVMIATFASNAVKALQAQGMAMGMMLPTWLGGAGKSAGIVKMYRTVQDAGQMDPDKAAAYLQQIRGEKLGEMGASDSSLGGLRAKRDRQLAMINKTATEKKFGWGGVLVSQRDVLEGLDSQIEKQQKVNDELHEQVSILTEGLQVIVNTQKVEAEQAKKSSGPTILKLTEDDQKAAIAEALRAKEKAADLERTIAGDRIRNAEMVGAAERGEAASALDYRKKALEVVWAYENQGYQSQIEHLDAIAGDERRTAEERMDASKQLTSVKIKQAIAEKDARLRISAADKAIAKQQVADQVASVQAAEERLRREYEITRDKLIETHSATRDQQLTDLQATYHAQLAKLKAVEKDTAKHLEKTEKQYEEAGKVIVGEFGQAVTKIITVDARAKVSFDEAAKAKLQEDLQSAMELVSGSIGSALTRMVTSFTTHTELAMSGIVSTVGDLVGGIGQAAGNGWVTAIGKVVGVVGDIWKAVEDGKKADEEADKRRKETTFQQLIAINALREETRKWLLDIGKLDPSNMSLNELRGARAGAVDQATSAVRTATGNTKLTSSDLETLAPLFERTAGINTDRLGGLDRSSADTLSGMVLSDEEKRAYYRLTGHAWTGTARDLHPGSAFTNARAAYLDGYSSTLSNYDSLISGYTVGAGIDHTKSISREDFESDLNTETTTGAVSAKEAARLRYEAAWGTGEFAGKTWGGAATSDAYRQDERTTLKYNWENWDTLNPASTSTSSSSGGIPQLGNGGLATTPSLVAENGQPELVLPLDKPQRTAELLEMYLGGGAGGGGHMSVSVSLNIDPNIPFNADSTRRLGRSLGDRVVTVARAQGMRV
jgi:hypothetical protein